MDYMQFHPRPRSMCGQAVKVDFLAWSRGQGTLQSSNFMVKTSYTWKLINSGCDKRSHRKSMGQVKSVHYNVATSAPSQKAAADFNGKRVLVTVRGWPSKLCPMTSDRLNELLKQLQEVI